MRKTSTSASSQSSAKANSKLVGGAGISKIIRPFSIRVAVQCTDFRTGRTTDLRQTMGRVTEVHSNKEAVGYVFVKSKQTFSGEIGRAVELPSVSQDQSRS